MSFVFLSNGSQKLTIENWEKIRALPKTAKSLIHKVAVVALYVIIGIVHALEGVLALGIMRLSRAKLHFTCTKIAFYSLYSYNLPKNSPYHSRFDFHHLSYGLAFMLIPGNSLRFGKWMTCCSLINYNQHGPFQKLDSQRFFFKGSSDHFEFVTEAIADDGKIIASSDGILAQVSNVSLNTSKGEVKDAAFPADNSFVRHTRDFLLEMFIYRKTPLLDSVCSMKDKLIEKIVYPYLKTTKGDPLYAQPLISIDYGLFMD